MQDFLEMLDLWQYVSTEITMPIVRAEVEAVAATNRTLAVEAVSEITEADVSS